MFYRILFAALCVVLFSVNADARQRHRVVSYDADPACNKDTGPNGMRCEGVAPSARGALVVKAMHGFGVPKQKYTPRASQSSFSVSSGNQVASVVAHPSGCPSRAFCGCGAAVRVFGSPIRSLWLAANWFKFPRAAPASGMVAVRSHHVFVLEANLGGGLWQVYDANSGRGLTRVHARSLAGYVIVNPRGGAA